MRTLRSACAVGALLAIAFAAPAAFADEPASKPWPGPTPREAADPAPIAPPRVPLGAPSAPASSSLPPVSASGTALLPSQDVAPSAVGIPSASVDSDASIRRLEERLDQEEAARKALEGQLETWRRVRISGWLQPELVVQLYNSAASPNVGASGELPPGVTANAIIARSDGTTSNGTFLRLRRARLTVEAMPTDYAKAVFMIDPAAFGGPSPGVGTIARTIEAIGIAKMSPDVTADFAMGIFKVPFMYELLECSCDRLFFERSWAESNLFPGDRDLGARMRLVAVKKKLQIDAAVLNGQTLGMPEHTALPDLGRGKDALLRAHYAASGLGIGLAGYAGEGDLVDRTALAYKTYKRFAGNLDFQFARTFAKRVGETRAFVELTYAQNLDRGLRYAFALPQAPAGFFGNPTDVQQVAGYLRVEQDVTEWITLAARYEFYGPNARADFAGRHTIGGLVGVHFTKGLHGVVDYAYARDNAAPKGVDGPMKEIQSIASGLLLKF